MGGAQQIGTSGGAQSLIRICVLDPEDRNGFLLADQLTALPARVDVVTRPEQAAEAGRTCHLLVCLGRHSGRRLAMTMAAFRENAGAEAPVVVLTEMAADAVRITCLLAGADYALTMPVSSAELLAVSRRLLLAAGRRAALGDGPGSAEAPDLLAALVPAQPGPASTAAAAEQ